MVRSNYVAHFKRWRGRVDFFSGVGKRALSSLLEGDSGVIIIIFSKS